MSARNYLALPIDADEGFPQAFRLNFNSNSYRIVLYMNVLEGTQPDANGFYTLPAAGAFMVLRVLQENSAGPTVILQRKLVLNLEFEAGDVAFRFTQMYVARSNLNGVGSFGSRVMGGIAARWA